MRHSHLLRATLCLLSATLSLGSARALLGAVQGIASLADREVEYVWDTPPIDEWFDDLRESVQRLSAIVYSPERTVNPTYGSSGSLDDRLNRVQIIRYNSADAVTYRYMGTGRQIGQELGNGVGFDYDAGTGNSPVSKLDRFGRVLDIEWTDGTPKLQYQYGYDAAGNRKFLRTNYHLENQDWLYEYDGLNRLVRASLGALNAAGDGLRVDLGVFTERWALDELGNWSAGTNNISFRRFVDDDGDGEFDSGESSYYTDHHATNEANEIASRVTGDASGTDPAVRFGYDAAGNLVFDGERFYRYDAFNRVVKIHAPGSVHVYPSGELTGTPGAVQATFCYDALGRRVETVTSSTTRHVYGSGAETLVEYGVSGGTETVLREFVWGTGGFPDPVVMFDLTAAGSEPAGTPEPLYYLKDALGSVGALTNASGAVVERYRYSPYGETTIAAPDYTSRPFSEYWNPFLWTGQHCDSDNKLYHFWARTYDPEVGRFLQRDPLGVLKTSGAEPGWSVGSNPYAGAPSLGTTDEFKDSLNLYQYVRGLPTALTDPSGRSLLGFLEDASARAYLGVCAYGAAHPVATRIVGGVLAAATLYFMIENPDYLDVLLSQPDAIGLLQLDMQLLLRSGKAIASLGAEGASLAFRTGAEAEAWVAKLYAGEQEVGVKTSLGWRKIDVLSGGRAHEVKVGFKQWGTEIWEQIRKDEEILVRKAETKIEQYTWHFFKSANTGKVGADPRVYEALNKAKILYEVH
jgi:RHS repeat-associated protein